MVGPSAGSVHIVHAEDIRIPRSLESLEAFREWMYTDAFPEKGRIDWICGEVEIDMSPEEIQFHSAVKSAISRKLGDLVDEGGRGVVYIDATRITAPEGEVSSEPDIVVVLFDSLAAGRARLVPRPGERAGSIEIEGAPDLVVECVSDSSVRKDSKLLREAYFRAGIPEYWIVDAREDPPRLDLLVGAPGAAAYEPAPAGPDGFFRSPVLERAVKLIRLPEKLGVVRYRLETRPA
jgi:Uma2 family endonuclease